jgi:hypothetical protein
MTTIFKQLENAVVADADAAAAEIATFFTDDVAPIFQAVLSYIETNGASDLLTIAKNALNAALSGIESGTAPEDVAGAVIGTVVNEAEAAGLSVAQGAATLAVSMAATAVTQAAATAAANVATPATPAADPTV